MTQRFSVTVDVFTKGEQELVQVATAKEARTTAWKLAHLFTPNVNVEAVNVRDHVDGVQKLTISLNDDTQYDPYCSFAWSDEWFLGGTGEPNDPDK
jgi:hypothetical protein